MDHLRAWYSGPPGVPNTIQRIRPLSRIITWTREGLTWEPDPRHVDLVVQSLGVKSTVVTPLVKDRTTIDEAEDEPLTGDDVTLYQSVTMRIGYISQDRTDLQRAVRELAKV